MDKIAFKVNGEPFSVSCEVSSDMKLLDYLRNTLNLRGTKYMCRQGACGSCIVAAVKVPGGKTVAVNSCLVSIVSCRGWDITTVERLGNRRDGYHPIQKAIAEYFGTQCGYCTPGWVMAMYSLLKSKKDLTMLEIEKSFASNICRCTGYRPILDALKTFATDAPKPKNITDIEDLNICSGKCAESTCKKDCGENEWYFVYKEDIVNVPYEINILLKDGKSWYSVRTVEDIFKLFNANGADTCMLICGNTSQALYPKEYPQNLIDISQVDELKGYIIDQNLIIGAANTLTEAIDIFTMIADTEYFEYMKKLVDHINMIASVSVRNIGSLAGNLMIKHEHRSFPSDIFLILETVGAQLTIATTVNTQETVTMNKFLDLDMKNKVILSVCFPPLNAEHLLVTFKIMPRAQNSLAIVNAGFIYKLKDSKVQEARITFGGLSSLFLRAKKSEEFLRHKYLFTNDTLQGTIKTLKTEMVVEHDPPEYSVEYKKQLALALFYKGLLILCPKEKICDRYRSGATNLIDTRLVSKGRQIYTTDKRVWPITQPIQKLEAMIQCSGEATFAEDLPTLPREVFAVFVVSEVCTGEIIAIDPSEALKQPGAIAFYSARDIPGLNSFTPANAEFFTKNEEILCDGIVKYYNQPIGIMVAETRYIAEKIAKMVKVTYEPGKKPVVDVKEAKNDPSRLTPYLTLEAKDRGNNTIRTIKSSSTGYWQYHFPLETLVCVTQPSEDSLKVYAATQWLDGTQDMIAKALNVDQNSIEVYVRRLGGGFGIKISRMTQLAVACSLVSTNLNRPCRFIQSLSANLRSVGKRFPWTSEYEVGVDSLGTIQYLYDNFYEDNGYMINETLSFVGTESYGNCYDTSRWNFKGFDLITDTAKNTWCRSPGYFENIANTEWIMEHIAYALGLDPIEVRSANIDSNKYGDIIKMIDDIKETADYTNRRIAVDKFNAENRWKKRGLRFSVMKWTPLGAQNLNITLSVYHGDGTVSITHGGIEMGQGMNTKAVQACAYYLQIPVEKIKIKRNDTMIAPNCYLTGSSVTTQNVMIGIKRCCDELMNRLGPFLKGKGDIIWEDLIQEAYAASINLQTHGFVQITEKIPYNISGVALCETEIDVLTGQREIMQVDLIEDAGRSVNPGIDIGQVEGAFMMGLGYWLSEKVIYDQGTGELLSDSAFKYLVPQCRDIPQNLVVSLKKNSYSTDLILGSKAIGEPGICLAVSVPISLREAIMSARKDSNLCDDEWLPVDGPCTVEQVCMMAATSTDDFKFD